MPQLSVSFSAVAKLLGRFWLNEIDLEMLQAIAAPEFRESFEELGGFVPDPVNSTVVEQLAVEYCSLLVGPQGHISPVESVWSENQFQSKSSSMMNRCFELIPGYVPASNISDHIGVQLDFLGELLARSGDEATDEIVEHFVATHLRWTAPFFDQIQDRTESRFYHGLAAVTRALIQSIQNEFSPAT